MCYTKERVLHVLQIGVEAVVAAVRKAIVALGGAANSAPSASSSSSSSSLAALWRTDFVSFSTCMATATRVIDQFQAQVRDLF